jgi:hypothetical protein
MWRIEKETDEGETPEIVRHFQKKKKPSLSDLRTITPLAADSLEIQT